MIEVLTPIWQRVLDRSTICPDDDFFDLGGDPSSAAKLFTEIANRCGRELPAVMIYHAPTIAAVADLLEQPTTPRFPPVVRLKEGSKEPPIFITHGLGGNIMELSQLVSRTRSEHPIYGMQARGIDGVDEPFDRIEDMAQFYLGAIKELQPHGPYLLIGYSMGGLVTFEMAQRLSKNGEKVALLAMLDSYPHARHLSFGQRVRLGRRLATRHASTVMRLPIGDALSYLIGPPERRLRLSGSGSAPDQPPISVSLAQPAKRLHESGYLAWTRYRPQFYSGKIRFVKAQVGSRYPDDPAAVWAKLAEELEVETVPGDHLGILTTHVESLASVVSRYIGASS
jgi:acetoacetyl-CoA synthetase